MPDPHQKPSLRPLAAAPSSMSTAPARPPSDGPDIPPTGEMITDTWAETADAAGEVRANREMPEPDSLGG
jgi:hypothetical protein